MGLVPPPASPAFQTGHLPPEALVRLDHLVLSPLCHQHSKDAFFRVLKAWIPMAGGPLSVLPTRPAAPWLRPRTSLEKSWFISPGLPFLLQGSFTTAAGIFWGSLGYKEWCSREKKGNRVSKLLWHHRLRHEAPEKVQVPLWWGLRRQMEEKNQHACLVSQQQDVCL